MERESERRAMIRDQLKRRNIRDPRVLDAMAAVPRHRFVPDALREQAYDDNALPIREQQTISQPYIVALMAAAMQLTGNERVLEVGTGSGYAAAVFSHLAVEVWTIERLPALAESAAQRLRDLGYTRVHVGVGDGTSGWSEHAPFDAIAVAAGGPQVPRALLEQLAPGGRLVIPVGSLEAQHLVRITATPTGFQQEPIEPVRFVPLVGSAGWKTEPTQPPESSSDDDPESPR